jgi:23S rRNA (uracil1939-C5)-methyltransferase
MEVTIERILPGGLGLAHAEGKTLLVSLAAPGDRLRVRVDRSKGNVSFASIEEVLEPSLARVEPPCPYFGRCGGCDFQQLNYEAQLAAKIEIVKDCLHRIGGMDDVPSFEIVAAPDQWHYRARAQWQYDSERKLLGYFEAGSHRVCDVAECAVLTPELQHTLEDLRARMGENSLPHDARYFRAISGDEGVSVTPGDGIVNIARSTAGETYQLSAESFFQTNIGLLPRLIDPAIGEATGEVAIELYCGVGLFTLPLGRRFEQVIAVEDDRDAAKFLGINLAGANLGNVEIANDDVGDWLEASLGRERKIQSAVAGPMNRASAGAPQNANASRADFLLLDPPRTGAESRVIAGILQIKPKRISYVSCDPATLARDVKKLIAGGFSIDSILAFDMFPQTHHVETVVHLSS